MIWLLLKFGIDKNATGWYSWITAGKAIWKKNILKVALSDFFSMCTTLSLQQDDFFSADPQQLFSGAAASEVFKETEAISPPQ